MGTPQQNIELSLARPVHTSEEVNIVREFRTVTGPVYAVENDDVDIDRMPYMMYAGFGIYRTN
jgi:hypothetical protein